MLGELLFVLSNFSIEINRRFPESPAPLYDHGDILFSSLMHSMGNPSITGALLGVSISVGTMELVGVFMARLTQLVSKLIHLDSEIRLCRVRLNAYPGSQASPSTSSNT